MKKIFSIILTATATTLSAQTIKERNIEPFTAIEVVGSVKVIYIHSDTLSLKLEGDEQDIEQVKTEVRDSVLKIDTKGILKTKKDVTVYVSYKQLNKINCSGASLFTTKNSIVCNSFIIQAHDAAKLKIKTQAKSVFVKESDAANLEIEGTVTDLYVNVSDASSIDAYKLISENANVKAEDAAKVKLYVTNKLFATANDVAKVKVKGDLKDMNVNVSDIASVTRVLEKEKSKSDTTSIEWKGKKMIIIDDDKDKKKSETKRMSEKFNHWAGFSLGVNGFLSPNGGFAMQNPYSYLDLNYSRSINVQLNLFQHNFHLYKNYVNLVTGFGIEWKRYMLDNNTTLNPDSSFTWGVIDNSNTYNFSKNLLRATMLQVPLLLDFNTNKNPKKAFHVSVGAVGQFMVGSRTKQKLESNGDKFTKIRKDNYNMNPVSVKAHASIGYSNITAFAEYNLTPLFAKNKGPQVTPFVIGINLIPF
ncbi:MAG: DUF2807 domain-containing protein [Bacteroidetes bacterium]|nr:DUF2807 domain-containing protein [Bacteroidota bacterium]